MSRFVSYLSTIFLLVASCGGDDGVDGLIDRAFLLQSSEGFTPVADTKVALHFKEGDIGFSAGCNHYSARLTIAGDTLVVDDFGSTAIGCAAALHAQDGWLATFFTSRPTYTLNEDVLTLTGEGATLVFLDREVANPDRPLVGTEWTVDTLISGDAASSFPTQVPTTITFGADGNVDVRTPCSAGTGSYEASGTTLSFGPVNYEANACSDAHMAADAHVRAVIREGQATYEIEAARLTLQRADRKGIAAIDE